MVDGGGRPGRDGEAGAAGRSTAGRALERQGWVHHVVDADTGEVLTTPLDRPLAPLSRAERLARLGHRIDLPSPWGPVYRLTPGTPTRPRRSTG
jgi:hypothetical protein